MYHFDIKPENVIIDDNFVIRLIDYGLSVSVEAVLRKCGGTEEYAPPEAWTGELMDLEKAEVFSLGVFLFNLMFLTIPFHAATLDEKHDKD